MADFRKEWRRIHEEFERLVEDFFMGKSPFFTQSGLVFSPPTDVFETKEEVLVRVAISGVAREEVRITLEGDRLAIRGERRDPGPQEKVCYHRKEIHCGPFLSLVLLPCPVEAEPAKAAMKDGVLLVRFRRKPPAPAERAVKIEIRF